MNDQLRWSVVCRHIADKERRLRHALFREDDV
jgi:hypothetical protein